MAGPLRARAREPGAQARDRRPPRRHDDARVGRAPAALVRPDDDAGDLSIRSAEKRCGKSRLLGLLARVGFNASPVTAHPTEAQLYRGAARTGGVQLFDEVESLRGTSKIPKVVGGITPACLDLASTLYMEAVDKVAPVSSTRVAEATKIVENVYRTVNIALVNELKTAFDRMGLDVWDVLDAAKTKPFGFHAFSPGPGLGGHCIPIDPFYLTWKAREYGVVTRFIELAGEVNSATPAHVVHRLGDALNARGKALNGSMILVLGVAYKRDTDDPRESPALEIIAELLEKGAHTDFSDPHFERLPTGRRHDIELECVPLTAHTSSALDRVACYANTVLLGREHAIDP